jgi:hypothetical protein
MHEYTLSATTIESARTRKAGGDKYAGKSAESANEWGTRDSPVIKADGGLRIVYAGVDDNADDDKHYDG